MASFQGKVVCVCTAEYVLIGKQELTRRQIAITGAASGMGLATAKLLASRGAILSLGDWNEKALLTAVESLPGTEKHMSTVIDVRDSETVDSWIQATVQALGRLDGAVNMAGIITPACPVTRMADADWDFNFAVNARGVFVCVRAQVNAMTNGGSIVSFLTEQSQGRSGKFWERKTSNDIVTGLSGKRLWTNGFSRRCWLLRQ